MKTNDGGPAFPTITEQLRGAGFAGVECTGMSLRDYFAGQALMGMLCSMANRDMFDAARRKAAEAEILLHEGLAISAYAHADALLAERDRST